MAISDAQFKAWLQDKKQVRCVLARLSFLGSNQAGGTQICHAYVSNMIYAPPAAVIRYSVCISEVPTISEEMSEQLTGQAKQSFTNLILSNKNGIRNNWLDLIMDGYEYIQYLGHPSWDFSDFRIVLTGVQGIPIDAGANRIAIPVSDRSALLNKQIRSKLLGGTGPEAGALVPLSFGSGLINITPKLVSSSPISYQISDVKTSAPTEACGYVYTVRENGVSLVGGFGIASVNTTTNVITATDPHGCVAGTRIINYFGFFLPAPLAVGTEYFVLASGLTLYDLKLSLTPGGTEIDLTTNPSGAGFSTFNWTYYPLLGQIQFVTNPAGTITATIEGLLRNPTLYTTSIAEDGSINSGRTHSAPGIIEHLLTSGLTDTPFISSDIDSTSFDDFYTDCPHGNQLFIDGPMTFSDAISQLALSVGGWYGFDTSTGKLVAGRLDLPVAGTAVYSFGDADIITGTLIKEKRRLPNTLVKVKGAKNWTVQTIGIGVTSDYERTLYGREFYIATSSLASGTGAIPGQDDATSHLLSTASDEFETLIAAEADTDTEVVRLGTFYAKPLDTWTFETTTVAFLIKKGDLIYVENDKFTGWGIVVKIEKKVRGNSTVKFLTQGSNYIPDTTPSFILNT